MLFGPTLAAMCTCVLLLKQALKDCKHSNALFFDGGEMALISLSHSRASSPITHISVSALTTRTEALLECYKMIPVEIPGVRSRTPFCS